MSTTVLPLVDARSISLISFIYSYHFVESDNSWTFCGHCILFAFDFKFLLYLNKQGGKEFWLGGTKRKVPRWKLALGQLAMDSSRFAPNWIFLNNFVNDLKTNLEN